MFVVLLMKRNQHDKILKRKPKKQLLRTVPKSCPKLKLKKKKVNKFPKDISLINNFRNFYVNFVITFYIFQ